ncbi:hypothetical protein AZF37_03190 [endosymbiont 'TC1' of Trimyema compressum]|uniref:molybdopterin-dependent oxidoreductase n=1 Tax=endosymbiont 'TC1' of Trimyema compressum TaxID=243899 RepID=UPI0007F0FB54|nr:molybdopterin cofactor-binding domain-containing protein [endosymbiont 'TC1' of Trimyema compressum]AMP20305.1 hypothetical protein AZF37_03190 [endosymbiont 'TC1' of Trimyema compressum]
MIETKFIVNGESITANVDEKETLLNYLRNELNLFGAKNGCNKAQCGACTVLIDGDAKRSCTVRMSKVEGKTIETIENLSKNGKLHPVQIGFIHTGAIQCGFCTPGFIMAAKGLLDKNLNPTEEEIRTALKFNICRCTGYVAIIDAVNMTAKILRGEPVEYLPEEGGMGVSVVGKDAYAKATGLPIYADDKEFPEMLYGKVLYTEYPYAIVKKIDTSKAEEAEGVVKVITAKDIPGRKTFGLLNPHQRVMVEEGDTALYMGESVATVFAETLALAEAATKLIEVEYEELEGVYTIEDALKENKAVLHKDKAISSHTKIRRGDTEKAFKECDVIVEAAFKVPPVEHAYMEPEACVTKYNDKGQLIVFMSHQGAYDMRNQFMQTLDLTPEQIIINTTPAGGGFGGKEEPLIHLHCALGTMYTKKPCKVVMTREESIAASTKRHGENIKMKYGCKNDGTFYAFEGRADVNGGAYDSLGGPVVFRSGVVMNGPYEVPFAHTDSIGHYTNTPPGGAFRGFGSTQVTFGAEILVDMMAEKLGMDPADLRIKNALKEGRQGITGQTMETGIGLTECIQKVSKRLAEIKDDYKPSGENKKIGIGIACSYKNVGIGIGLKDGAGAALELTQEGTILLKHGAASIGQGPDTTMALIASEASGIPYSSIDVINNITPICPDGEETTASRQTFVTGNATKAVAEQFDSALRREIEKHFSIKASDVKYVKDGFKSKSDGKTYTFKELVGKTGPMELEYEYIPPQTSPLAEDNTPKEGDIPVNYKIHYSYTYATHGVILEADEITGEYKVLKVIAAQDLGKAVHPLQSKGQVEGGVAMGLGYGQSEEFVTNKGRIVTDNLAKLKVPKITDMPDIEIILVEEPQIEGPFGAKGMGELPVNPVAPAISNALFNALGVRMCELPITKEKVKAALDAK